MRTKKDLAICLLGGFIGSLIAGLAIAAYYHFSQSALWGYIIGTVIGQILIAVGVLLITQRRKRETRCRTTTEK